MFISLHMHPLIGMSEHGPRHKSNAPSGLQSRRVKITVKGTWGDPGVKSDQHVGEIST
jgi:hypothetical protein